MKRIAFLLIILFFSCKENSKKISLDVANTTTAEEKEYVDTPIEYAKGFSIKKQGALTIIKVTTPWPNASKTYTYALIDKKKMESIRINSSLYDAIIPTPINHLVATSTTHIPAIEALGAEKTLIGFPGTDYISSKNVRKRIDEGKVKNLGLNESINTEVLINLQPDAIIGFTVEGQNKTYTNIENAGIPVVYNGDWVEETPLGKAEWIKFFGPFFQKEKEADSIFNAIAKSYNEAKTLASQAKNEPTVLSGSMFKDIWYVPAGKSWVAHFLNDAHASYLWKDSFGTGSLSLNFETVLEKAKNADFWIGPGQFVSYNQLKETNAHYTQFKAYEEKKIYTYSLSAGATGGLLYYELAPNRPDIVLKDMIHILHPEILPDYQPVFFKQLQP